MSANTHGAMPELLPCPFCSRTVPDDLSDTLYPSGSYWRDVDGLRHYISHRNRMPDDNACWGMHCTVSEGGCGAQITADSREEVIAKWNRRAVEQAAGAVPELLQSCRGSVKADLMRNEQLLLVKRVPNLHAVIEAEANRLQALLDSIDALAAGREAGSSDHLAACDGGGVTQWRSVDELPEKGRTPILVAVAWIRHGEHEDGTLSSVEGVDVTEGQYVPQFGDRAGYFESFQGTHWDGSHVTHWMPLPSPPAKTGVHHG